MTKTPIYGVIALGASLLPKRIPSLEPTETGLREKHGKENTEPLEIRGNGIKGREEVLFRHNMGWKWKALKRIHGNVY